MFFYLLGKIFVFIDLLKMSVRELEIRLKYFFRSLVEIVLSLVVFFMYNLCRWDEIRYGFICWKLKLFKINWLINLLK